MKKIIPNSITLLNLLFGCFAVIFALQGTLIIAAVFILIGILLDFLDGFLAHLLNAKSEIGKQLDSLADVVTSGLAPALIMVQMLFLAKENIWDPTLWQQESYNILEADAFPLWGLAVVLAAAYRLAKFNTDERQTDSFIGLPTPSSAILLISLPLILTYQPSEIALQLLMNEYVLLGIILLVCILMNSNLHLFSLKFRTRGYSSNSVRYIFLLVSLVLLVAFWFVAIPLIIALYILVSIFRREIKTGGIK